MKIQENIIKKTDRMAALLERLQSMGIVLEKSFCIIRILDPSMVVLQYLLLKAAIKMLVKGNVSWEDMIAWLIQ